MDVIKGHLDMKHINTKTILSYWETRRRSAPAPARADIAPADLGSLLSHIFLLRRMDSQHHVFRLAGSELCKLHCREFRDQNFLSLWLGQDRHHVMALLEGALGEPAPARAIVDALTLDGRKCEVELTVLPLRGPEGWLDRVLGLYQPINPSDLGGRPIVRHKVRQLYPAFIDDAWSMSLRESGSLHMARAANDS